MCTRISYLYVESPTQLPTFPRFKRQVSDDRQVKNVSWDVKGRQSSLLNFKQLGELWRATELLENKVKAVLDRHKLRVAVAEKLVVSTGCLRGGRTEKQNRAGHVGFEAGFKLPEEGSVTWWTHEDRRTYPYPVVWIKTIWGRKTEKRREWSSQIMTGHKTKAMSKEEPLDEGDYLLEAGKDCYWRHYC